MNRVTTRSWKILCWNVRGLNSDTRQRTVREKVSESQCSVVCLQETKLQDVSMNIVRQCLGNTYESFFYLPAAGTRGGILVAWDESVTHLSNPHYTS